MSEPVPELRSTASKHINSLSHVDFVDQKVEGVAVNK